MKWWIIPFFGISVIARSVVALPFPCEELWSVEFQDTARSMGRIWTENDQALYPIGLTDRVLVVDNGHRQYLSSHFPGSIAASPQIYPPQDDDLQLIVQYIVGNLARLRILNWTGQDELEDILIDTCRSHNNVFTTRLSPIMLDILNSEPVIYSFLSNYYYRNNDFGYGDEARSYGTSCKIFLNNPDSINRSRTVRPYWTDIIQAPEGNRAFPILIGVEFGEFPYEFRGEYYQIVYGFLDVKIGPTADGSILAARLDEIIFQEYGTTLRFGAACIGLNARMRKLIYISHSNLDSSFIREVEYPSMRIIRTLYGTLPAYSSLVYLSAGEDGEEFLLALLPNNRLHLINLTRWSIVGEFDSFRDRIVAIQSFAYDDDPEPEIAVLESHRLTVFDLSPLIVNEPDVRHYSIGIYSFPNPFNSSTTISYTLPKAGWTTMDVVDVSGRLVERLSGGWKAAGEYREVWRGQGIPSGSYLLRIESTSTRNTPVVPIRLVR
jgi:hypothetical protein